MTASAFQQPASPPAREPVSIIRARAAADVRTLRALARAALRDGLPKAELRAANALAAARSVLDHARRLSPLGEQERQVLRRAEMAD